MEKALRSCATFDTRLAKIRIKSTPKNRVWRARRTKKARISVRPLRNSTIVLSG
jgi:hypothetical protein